MLTGWVFAPRRTVTRTIRAAGDTAHKHDSSSHRLFSTARWSLDAVGLAVVDLIASWSGDTIFVAIDDTLARKRGLAMFGTGMHHDPLLSSRGKKIMNWGHRWVVVGAIVELPFRPGHYYCLPILFRLYLNKKKAARHRRVYRTRPELAVAMLEVLCKHRQNKRFHAIADSAYGGQSVLANLPAGCDLTQPPGERRAVARSTAGTQAGAARPFSCARREVAHAARDARRAMSAGDMGHLRPQRSRASGRRLCAGVRRAQPAAASRGRRGASRRPRSGSVLLDLPRSDRRTGDRLVRRAVEY
jgi:hypothetical protein